VIVGQAPRWTVAAGDGPRPGRGAWAFKFAAGGATAGDGGGSIGHAWRPERLSEDGRSIIRMDLQARSQGPLNPAMTVRGCAPRDLRRIFSGLTCCP
jgi:hypothetical protein